MSDWIACKDLLPPEGAVVETKLAGPDRNVSMLARQGSLWFFPDRTMHVYYTPTHWRPATREQLSAEAARIRRTAEVDAKLADRIERQP